MSTPQYTEDVHILEGDELVTNLPPIVAQPGVDWVNQLFGGGDSDACNGNVADDSETLDTLEGDNPQLPHSQLPRLEDPGSVWWAAANESTASDRRSSRATSGKAPLEY